MNLTYPWFLLGLIALAIPIILHLFELRRPQRVLFTNVDFIKDVKLVTAKQRRLQHLLVLFLRLGFISFLVLLFCQPFLQALDNGTTGVDSRTAFVIDNTLSMSAEDAQGQQLIERGADEAGEVVGIFPRTATIDVLAGSRRQASLTPQRAQEALNAVTVSANSQGLGAQLAWLTSGLRNSNPSSVFLVSDFQRIGFNPSMIMQLGTKQQVYLLPLRFTPAASIYVDSVYVADEFVRPGGDLALQIRLRNGGSKDAQRVGVRVLIAERQVGAFQIDLLAGQTTVTTVRARLNGAQAVQCRVEVDDQPIRFDNTYYFVLKPVSRVRILEVGAGRSALQRLYPNEAVFGYSQISVGDIRPEVLSNADFIVVSAFASSDSGRRTALRRFADAGGTILFIPAANSAGASLNEALADLGLSTLRPLNGAGASTPQELAPPDKQNPFFKDVFAEQTRQADMPRATPLLTWSRSAVDVLKFRDGSPFISGFRTGNGMIYVVASPLAPAYTTFAEHPLFVPVMYRLATSSVQLDQLPAYRLTDRTVVLRQPVVANAGKEQVYKLVNDGSSFIPAQQVRDGRLYLQLPPDLRQPGYYKLSLGEHTVGELAFNIDKKESELAYYSLNELRQLEATHPNVHIYEVASGQSVAARFAQQRAGTPLWRYCLIAALLCLLGEVLVLRFAGAKNTAAPLAA
ncbi:BatA domain-containing protein [Hymenobacter latericus]|uniref:BatA domain-containing protein n=1 Tax=Hymenobacter sp. YIM 151858-1 TaxID=2987688 RepID=UPI002226E317|nr:BatA domain-containing protein [Hymenobacter sp. YIM 151858-1]UYZ59435.1 BatA domain-containing protein [Hymenobacter sp. YIM 151858-1]